MAEESWFSDGQATFGDRIAGAREAAGMTQKDLANRLGIKLDTLKGWENDIKEPRANKLQMVAGVLGVSISWLLTGTGEGPTEPVETGEVPADLSSLLGEMRSLRTQMQQQVEKMGQLEKRLRAALKE